jgi:Pyruvate/2-oxoacid:ferredoxin oxidoreductase delta subunit
MTSRRYDLDFPLEVTNLQIHRIDIRCVDCGACCGFCPAGCFVPDAVSGRIEFDGRHCTACGFCVKACPRQAMELAL